MAGNVHDAIPWHTYGVLQVTNSWFLLLIFILIYLILFYNWILKIDVNILFSSASKEIVVLVNCT